MCCLRFTVVMCCKLSHPKEAAVARASARPPSPRPRDLRRTATDRDRRLASTHHQAALAASQAPAWTSELPRPSTGGMRWPLRSPWGRRGHRGSNASFPNILGRLLRSRYTAAEVATRGSTNAEDRSCEGHQHSKARGNGDGCGRHDPHANVPRESSSNKHGGQHGCDRSGNAPNSFGGLFGGSQNCQCQDDRSSADCDEVGDGVAQRARKAA